MANHLSAKKRIRQTEKRRLHNKYYAKSTRNAVNQFRLLKDKDEAVKMYPGVASKLDKLAKINVIHKNKASNIKSSLYKYMNSL